jgi:hypothetical protein
MKRITLVGIFSAVSLFASFFSIPSAARAFFLLGAAIAMMVGYFLGFWIGGKYRKSLVRAMLALISGIACLAFLTAYQIKIHQIYSDRIDIYVDAWLFWLFYFFLAFLASIIELRLAISERVWNGIQNLLGLGE